jgi:glucose-1-phosphate cytidylyltransferase
VNPKVVILAGGLGTRLKEETEYRPKPMVEIGNKPIIWHIMKIYQHYGFNDFIICLGYKGHIIKEFFLNYQSMINDFTIHLGTKSHIEYKSCNDDFNATVTLIDTGLNAMTGSRIKQIESYIDSDNFFLTYGDGVANVDIQKLYAYHLSHGKIGTMTGVHPPSRFGEFSVKNNQIIDFNEKPEMKSDIINGGFFVLKTEFFKYLSSDESCILEREPLKNLSNDGELMLYKHDGFWQCMDTYRELLLLNDMWKDRKASWAVWDRVFHC